MCIMSCGNNTTHKGGNFMVRKILNIPCSKPAVKFNLIQRAWKNGEISNEDLHRIKRQWRYTTPNIKFPVLRRGNEPYFNDGIAGKS